MTLSPEASRALERSIVHWIENVKATSPDKASTRSEDCALCEAFPSPDCWGCPVARVTGDECTGSPYYNARDALREWRKEPDDEFCKENWQLAAQAELDFLISLRDPTE